MVAIGGSRGRHVRVLVSAGAPRSEKQSKKMHETAARARYCSNICFYSCNLGQRKMENQIRKMWTRLQRELNCHAWAARDLCASDYCSGKQCRFVGASAQCGLATGGDETDWHGCAQCALECISDFAILLLPRKPSCRKKWCTDESGSFARNFSKRRSVWFFTFYNLLYSFAFLYSVVWRFVCLILICRFNKWKTTMVLRHGLQNTSCSWMLFLCCAKPLFGKKTLRVKLMDERTRCETCLGIMIRHHLDQMMTRFVSCTFTQSH